VPILPVKETTMPQTVALVTVTLRVSINHSALVKNPEMLFEMLEVTKATINDEAVDDVQTVEIDAIDIVEE
jgi:hypothetical protein